MHLGNARTALLSWLHVRAKQGTFLLRIEDLDRARWRPEYLRTIYDDLRYLGLDWDEEPWVQSERQVFYDQALQQLARAGRIYPCFCTRAEIANAVSAPHGPADDGPRYPGTCAALSPEQVDARSKLRPAALRFRPSPGVTSFVDGVSGPFSQDVADAVGDFVVRRNDGVASYQLAVVVDDAASGITHVLRGDDLLSSTPRQLQLFAALDSTPPAYAHVPLWMGADGKRLAKRSGAFAVADLRAAGVPAERVVGTLARLSGLSNGEPCTARSLIAAFDLQALPRTPVLLEERELERRLRFLPRDVAPA